MPVELIQTLALETYARRSYNYFNRMVDAEGLPYFNIFWTEPAEAAHDWPDFGDVMSRQLQGAIMGRRMTGVRAPIEATWYARVLASLGPDDGLLYRPATTYSQHVADAGDQALTLYALVTAYADNSDPNLAAAIRKMVDSLAARSGAEGHPGGFLGGFAIKSLMACARVLEYEPALDLAGRLVRQIFAPSPHAVPPPLFSPDNTFRHGGHMHGNLRCLVGAADYALATHDPVLYSRVDALYRWVRSTATSFGFLPEVIGRQSDVVLCETCALMDYLGLAVTLANHGHPEYWGDIERVVRNQLIENQLTDASWLAAEPPGTAARDDTYQFTWRDVGERMVGGYAGWSSPTHILAVRETLGAHWGGDELHGKTRAFQNCCGGSGTHAFYLAWKNAARYEDGRLDINLHLDKLLPQAEIRSYQPYQGLLTISLTAPAEVRVRIPEWVNPDEMRVEAATGPVSGEAWGNYLHLGSQPAGARLRISYPLAEKSTEEAIGNPGWRQYRYRAAWRGDTVIEMTPLGNDYETGYSDFDRRDVPVYFGEAGPGRLYQRRHLLTGGEPALAELQLDDDGPDFWHGLA